MTKIIIKQKEKELLNLTSAFCKGKLNDDYLQLSEKLIKKLGRKRSVPFITGKIEIWAAGIIHALGQINFLYDKSAEPYISTNELNDYFGTKQSTVTGKSKQIRDLLKLFYFDKEFSVKGMIEANPLNDMVMVDGFIVPMNTITMDLQELVKKRREEGSDIEFTTE